MMNIIRNIFAVIGLICTAGSVTVALRCMWEGWKERHEDTHNNAYYFNDNWDNYHD